MYTFLSQIKCLESASRSAMMYSLNCKIFVLFVRFGRLEVREVHESFRVFEANYSACRRRGGVLNSPSFCFFFRCQKSVPPLKGDTAGHKPREPT